jgi:hypothetical protein
MDFQVDTTMTFDEWLDDVCGHDRDDSTQCLYRRAGNIWIGTIIDVKACFLTMMKLYDYQDRAGSDPVLRHLIDDLATVVAVKRVQDSDSGLKLIS